METRDLLSDAYAPCDGVVVNRLGDETVALDLANGTYYGFDRVGTILWVKLTAGEQLSSACGHVAAEFGVPIDQVEADARIYVNDLLENKLIYRK